MKNLGNVNHEHGGAGNRRISSRRLSRDLLVVSGLLMLTFSALPILNRFIRDRLIHRLTQRVSQSSDDQVEVPIRQLAGLGLPAIKSLVAICASNRPVAAAVARDEVDQQLAAWLIQAGIIQPGTPVMRELADHHPTFLSSRMGQLAEALARHVESMDAIGQHWSERIAMRILLHADHITPAQSVRVLADCQAVLAAVSHEDPLNRDRDGLVQAAPRDLHMLPLTRSSLEWSSLATSPRLNLGQLEQLGPHAQRLSSHSSKAPSPDPTGNTAKKNHESQSILQVPPPENTTHGRGLTPGPQRHGRSESSQAGNSVRLLAEPSELANLSVVVGNLLRDRNPMVSPSGSELLETEPTVVPSIGAPPGVAYPPPGPAEHVFDVPTPPEMAARREQLQAMSLRELMVLLGNSRDFEAALIRTVARARGLLDADLALAPKLGSPQTSERLELLQQLSQLPARHARRWLRWLLEDDQGDVRLRALTMMATTSDPHIESLARRRLMEDTDPRVVALAKKIVGWNER